MKMPRLLVGAGFAGHGDARMVGVRCPSSYNSVKKNATFLWGSMTERFLKFIPTEEAFWLLHKKPNAFLLLTHIANTARRTQGNPDGLIIGQCHLQHWTFYDLTEQEYRTAKNILIMRNHIKIIETNRTRQKSTTGSTTASTLVQLISSMVYDINPEDGNDRINDRTTTEQRLNNDKQEGIRKKKNEKEDHPSIPSFGLIDDFSFDKEKIEIITDVFLSKQDLDLCIQLKGDIEKVKHAIEFIQNNKSRKHSIANWPNALSKWKVEDKLKNKIQDHISTAEKLCNDFPEHKNGRGWRCLIHHDRKKDQRGLLFESESPFLEPFFVDFGNGEFIRICEDFIKTKKMREKC